MSIPVTIRIRQQGYVRITGYQATQWAVTVPVSDPPSDPPIATDPLSYAQLFVVRNVGGFDSFERIATLSDFATLPVSELKYFDVRGAGGDSFFLGALPGDTLRITTSLPHWLQNQAPYTDQDFIIAQIANRVQGTAASCFTGSQLQLPGYTFTNDDIGRWVLLSGFANPANNGYAQILGYTGSTARVNKTFTNDTGGTWAFPWVRVQESFAGLEPRYFPTRERGLSWELRRGGALIAAGGGGATMREIEAPLVRSVRNTTISPTLDAALDLFNVVRHEIANLQRAATRNNTAFTVLITTTVGP
jgi:hypothetical protein